MAKVLVIEDEPDFSELIGSWLKSEHHTIETVDNGEEALDRLSGACDAVDERRIYDLLCELVPEHQSRMQDENRHDQRSAVVVPLRTPGPSQP